MTTLIEAWYYLHVHSHSVSTHTYTHVYHTHTHTHTHTHQVKEVYVKENDSIGEDEVILEFYPEEQD